LSLPRARLPGLTAGGLSEEVLLANVIANAVAYSFEGGSVVVLSQAGHSVEVLADTEGVVGYLRREPPELLILDVMFPEHSSAGFDLAREIRKDKQLARLLRSSGTQGGPEA